MMALMDILEAAQDGQFFANAGAAVGIDETRARDSLRAICPAIAEALRAKAEDEAAFDRLLDMLEDGDGDAFLDDPALLSDPEVRKDGTAILADLYGPKKGLAALQPLAKDLTPDELAKLAPIGAASVLAALGRANASKLGIASPQPEAQSEGGGLLGAIVSAVVEGVVKGATRSLSPPRRRRRYSGYYRTRRRTTRRRTRRPSLNDIFGELLGTRR
jgi:hypothetical protein